MSCCCAVYIQVCAIVSFFSVWFVGFAGVIMPSYLHACINRSLNDDSVLMYLWDGFLLDALNIGSVCVPSARYFGYLLSYLLKLSL